MRLEPSRVGLPCDHLKQVQRPRFARQAHHVDREKKYQRQWLSCFKNIASTLRCIKEVLPQCTETQGRSRCSA